MQASGGSAMKLPRMGLVTVALMSVLCVTPAFAAEGEIGTNLSLNVTATTRMELLVGLAETISVPFLAGDGPMTRENNVKFKLGVDVSPVTLNGSVETVWTPVAFLELVAGATAGTGWNLPIADGLRMNTPGRDESGLLDGSADYTGDSFMGIVWSVKGGAALQFDWAVVRPGEWNHVVFRTYQGLFYRALSTADDDESWLFKNNEGEERNGWNYYANYLLAWRIPVRLTMIGVLFEQELHLYDTEGSDAWGEDYSRFTVGITGQYRITDNLSALLAVQMRSERNFEGESGDYDFYQSRVIDGDDPRRFEFYRALLGVTLRLD